MKKILLGVVVLVMLAVLAGGLGLLWAHVSLRGERSSLPNPADVPRALASDSDVPTAVSWINSASQDMPRSAVLDPDRDPTPEEPYRMSHSSFVLEWSDGRLLLVDVGMTPESARTFGKPAELVVGARPTEPHLPTATQLGARAADVDAVIFSHLHTDHVEGVAALCAGRDGPLRVYGTKAQLVRPNYTTRPGLEILKQAECVELVALEGSGPLLEVPGFPGVRVIAVAGHTPGSQVVVAQVAAGDTPRLYAFTGDTANARDGIRHDIPKPWLYSTFVIPEDTERLSEVRRLLRTLERDQKATLLVPHDEHSIEDTDVLRWTGP